MSIAEFPAAALSDDDPRRFEGPGRTPPQDNSAEQGVLGAMMLSKDAIADVVETVRGTDFYRPAHETIFDAVIDLYGRGEPADALTVSAELQRRGELVRVGGAPYLHTLVASVPVAANAGYYAEIVREKAILRRLVSAGTKIVQIGYAGEGEVDAIVDTAQAEIYDVTQKRTSEDYAPLSEIMEATLDEIEAIGARGGQMTGVPTGFADLDALTNGLHPGQMVIVAARPGIGKALALDTPLPTPRGWTTMGEVAKGDQLLGADGRPTTVVAVTDVMRNRPCYRVSFSDGTTIVADAQHQWATTTRASRRQRSSLPPASGVRTTEELALTLRCATADARLNHAVRTAEPLELPERQLLLPPYVLGVWLGDGHSAGARFTSADPEIPMFVDGQGVHAVPTGRLLYTLKLPVPEVELRNCLVCGASFRPGTSQVRTCGRSCGGRLKTVAQPVGAPRCPDCGKVSSGLRQCQTCRDDHGTVTALLRKLGVLGDKHIPAAYLRASGSQRRALLAGLMDTDGTVTSAGACQISLTNRRLAFDTQELVVSLGYRCSMTQKPVRGRNSASSIAYTLNFTAVDAVFWLPRKAIAHKERRRSVDRRRSGSRMITAVDRVASVPVKCVQVDSDDHLYLAGRSMVPTHNSTLGLDIARSAAIQHGMASVIFSLEMTRTEITMRLLCAEAKINMHHMRNGHMSDDDWARLARKMGEVSNAPLFIDDSPHLTMMEIRAKARRLRQRHDLRLVVVDYMQLMQSGKRVESRQVEVSEFSRQMKLLAKELNVPVVAISQLNRGPEQRTDKRPLLSDLRESGSLEQDSDMVILLHREDVYDRESPRAGEADLIVAKHRNGPTQTVTVAFQGQYSRFVDMAH